VDAPKNENDYYGLRYGDFVVPLVKAVQEQQAMIEELKSRNEELLKRIEKLEKD
jgi:cell division protein FtsB